ncbi:unnamed protein product [Arctogadus glacialis]
MCRPSPPLLPSDEAGRAQRRPVNNKPKGGRYQPPSLSRNAHPVTQLSRSADAGNGSVTLVLHKLGTSWSDRPAHYGEHQLPFNVAGTALAACDNGVTQHPKPTLGAEGPTCGRRRH